MQANSPNVLKLPAIPRLQLNSSGDGSQGGLHHREEQINCMTPLATPATNRGDLTIESKFKAGYDLELDEQAMCLLERYLGYSSLEPYVVLAHSRRLCPNPGDITTVKDIAVSIQKEYGNKPPNSARVTPMHLDFSMSSPAPCTPAKAFTPMHHQAHKLECVMLNSTIRSTQPFTAELVPCWEQQLADASVYLAPYVGDQVLELGRGKLLTEACQRPYDPQAAPGSSLRRSYSQGGYGTSSSQQFTTMRISNVSQDDKDQQEVRQVVRSPYVSDGGKGQLEGIAEDPAAAGSDATASGKLSQPDARDTALLAFNTTGAVKLGAGVRKVRGPLAGAGVSAAPGVPQLQGLPFSDLRKSVTAVQSARAHTAREASTRDTARERDVLPSLHLPPLESTTSPLKPATTRDTHRDRTTTLTAPAAELVAAAAAHSPAQEETAAPAERTSIKSFPLSRIRDWWSCSRSWQSSTSSTGSASPGRVHSSGADDAAAAISNLHLIPQAVIQELGTVTPMSTVRLPRQGLDSYRASLPAVPDASSPKTLNALASVLDECPGRHEQMVVSLTLQHTVGNSDSAVVRRGKLFKPTEGDAPLDVVVKIYSEDRLLDGVAEILALEHLIGWQGCVQLLGYSRAAAGDLLLLLQSCDCNLDEWAKEKREDENTQWARTAISVFVEVAQLVAGLHELGVAHCDLKPQNILMLDGQPLLADFSEARACQQAPAVQELHLWEARGTEAYNSSEMHKASKGEPVDVKAADVWGLACILFELITGCMLFHGRLDNLRPHLPQGPDGCWMTDKEVELLCTGCGDNHALEAEVRSLILDVCRKQELRPSAQQVADRAASILSGFSQPLYNDA